MSWIRHTERGASARLGKLFCGVAVAAAFVPANSAAEDADASDDGESPERIVITGRRATSDALYAVDTSRVTPAAADAAEFMKLIPGADVNDNGTLSGQVHYRGLAGTRMNVLVDGMNIANGGPNWMDPPLHYAPRPLLESLELERGIASVSTGLETLGGTARARLKSSAFTRDDSFSVHADVEAVGRSVDSGFAGGGLVSVANRMHRFHVLGSAEIGNDVWSAAGKLRASRHERYNAGAGYGLRLGDHEFGIDYRRSEAEDTGNPVLPMDIAFVDSNIARGSYRGEWRGIGLEASLGYNDVDHGMDNFSLRPPPPNPMRFRTSLADSRGLDYDVVAKIPVPVWESDLSVGVDGNLANHNMEIVSPNNGAFFVDNFNDVQRDRYGVFAEWTGEPFERWQLELGARYTRVASDAGRVDALLAQMPGPAQNLRDAFNAADRDKSNDDVDWVVKLAFLARDELRIDVGVARKMRAPYYVERYAWLPLQTSAGLADGNNYVGDIDLDPELSHEVEGGISWRGEWVYVAPRGFYRHVKDYIQGAPSTNLDVIKVSTLNGDRTPLQFTNVDAELYGIDAEYGVRLPLDFQLDGTVSYVRGRRRDVSDDLYRIPPLRGRTTLSYRRSSWTAGIEGVYAARQTEVSAENGETPTPSYALMNLFVEWQPWRGLDLTAGIDNVLDAFYQDHLAGTNRVRESAVPVGVRLPGAGRNFFARIGWSW
jgi:iron complex outermembrane receptor protein